MKTVSVLHILTVALLITGTTVGAGMLGLPIKTGLLGMLPSLVSMIMMWAFMFITALILILRDLIFPHYFIMNLALWASG